MFIVPNFAQLKYTIVYTWIVLPGIQRDKIQIFGLKKKTEKKKRFGFILVNTTWIEEPHISIVNEQ